MITNGWFDWAEHTPGPQSKLWPDTNAVSAVFFHSAVGTAQGVTNIVMGPVSNNRSVTGCVCFDGRLIQYYPVWQSPWANGSHYWNAYALGFEMEGGYDGDGHWISEPLYPPQVMTCTRILEELATYRGVQSSYWQRPNTLKEHREVYPTACPSDRIPWDLIIVGLQPELPAGIGAHYTNGTDEEIWVPRPGLVLDGVGMRYSPSNRIETIWP